MPADIISGKEIAAAIRSELRAEVDKLKEEGKREPGLAVIIVGERKDSQTYVRLKHKVKRVGVPSVMPTAVWNLEEVEVGSKVITHESLHMHRPQAAEECGYQSFQIAVPADITQEQLVEQIDACNNNPAIHGLIVQLPLPKHINEAEVLNKIAYEKDVDGLGPDNICALYTRGKEPASYPCTPLGIVTMLERSNVQIEGARAVVIGRSNIVGLPVAHMLMQRNATVTVCHTRTKDMAAVCRGAEIIVAAAGCLEMVKADWVAPGAVVIDVGTNCVDDATKKQGYRTVGDVDFAAVKEVAGKISPVPGGVGPMTIAMLLSNTMRSYKRADEVDA